MSSKSSFSKRSRRVVASQKQDENTLPCCLVCQSIKVKALGMCHFIANEEEEEEAVLHVECGTSSHMLLTEESVTWRYGKGKAARTALETCRRVTPIKQDEEEEETGTFYYLASEIEGVKGVRLLKRAAKVAKTESSSSAASAATKKDAEADPEAMKVDAAAAAAVSDDKDKDDEKQAPVEEKRLARYRPTCSNALAQRIQRAKSQRMYLVCQSEVEAESQPYGGPSCTFTVLGSTGNVYSVQVCKKPSCSCPDAAKGNLCKHLVFVLLKVVGLESNSPLIYQAALLTCELEEIFETMQARRAVREGANSLPLANAAVRARYQQLTSPEKQSSQEDGDKKEDDNDESGGVQRRSLEDSPECPICCDPMSSSDSLTYCKAACGTNFHLECMTIWAKRQTSRGDTTCPACRQPWLDDKVTGEKKRSVDEGYTNLGSLQGLSSVRETHTYYHGYGYRYGRRRYYDD